MNEEQIAGMLASLRQERMERSADDRIRERLEQAWAERAARRGWGFRLRRLAPVLATLVLVAGVFAATMNASGDSALYGIRIGIEDAAVLLHPEPEDRNQYLLALLDERQAEAARLESSGNALAASRVREVEQNTLRMLSATLPQPPAESQVTAPESPSPSPSESPMPSPTPIATAAPLTTRTPSPTPRPTATPSRTPSPTPAQPTGTPFSVTLTGNVKNPDYTLADGACVSIALPADLTAPCTTKTTQGTYRLTISGRVNQTVTVYAWRYDATTEYVYKGSSSAIIRGSTVQMPDIKLVK